VYIYSVKKIFE